MRGDGAYIFDSQGRQYLDASGGAAVSCLGHNHPKVIEAIKHQLDAIPFAHTAVFSNIAMEHLADDVEFPTVMIMNLTQRLQRTQSEDVA